MAKNLDNYVKFANTAKTKKGAAGPGWGGLQGCLSPRPILRQHRDRELPTIVGMQKSNMSKASAIGTLKRASKTLAIEWACGEQGQPELQNPVGNILSWLRYWDSLDHFDPELVKNAWCNCWASIKSAAGAGETCGPSSRQPCQPPSLI